MTKPTTPEPPKASADRFDEDELLECIKKAARAGDRGARRWLRVRGVDWREETKA